MSNNNKDLLNFTHAFHTVTEKCGIECILSYRTIERISKLESVISDLNEVMNISLLKGLDIDDLNIIYKELNKYASMKKNKYAQALIKQEDIIQEEEEKKEDESFTSPIFRNPKIPFTPELTF